MALTLETTDTPALWPGALQKDHGSLASAQPPGVAQATLPIAPTPHRPLLLSALSIRVSLIFATPRHPEEDRCKCRHRSCTVYWRTAENFTGSTLGGCVPLEVGGKGP